MARDREVQGHQEEESIIKRTKKSRCIGEGDPDNHPLLNQIGRYLSIECLARISPLYYGTLAQINRGFRSLIRSGEIYSLNRHNLLCYDPNHWIYFYFFTHKWLCYDPNHNHWVWIPPPPSTMTGARNMTFKRFDKLLAVGTDLVLVVLFRTQYSSPLVCVVLKYSLLTRSWSYGIPMNSPRLSFGSASLGTKAIVAGGVSGGIHGGISNCAELYDSEKETWLPLPDMNKPRMNSSCVFMDGKFYIIGGESIRELIHYKKLTCGEVYDPERRVWTVIPNMAACHNRGEVGAFPNVAVVRNELYAEKYPENELVKFDKKYNSWITLGGLPERSSGAVRLRGCGERLVVISARTGIHSWIPDERPPIWDTIAPSSFPSHIFSIGCEGGLA